MSARLVKRHNLSFLTHNLQRWLG